MDRRGKAGGRLSQRNQGFMVRRLDVAVESWPIAGSFAISRGVKTEALVVVATVGAGPHSGRGECVPYPRYGETVDGVARMIRGMELAIADGMTREELRARLPAGAARNALDCALIDLEAKRAGRSAADMLGIGPLHPVETAFTLSLDTAEKMAAAALKAAGRSILKLKLGGAGDPERLAAVRAAAPNARLIVDANEAWSANNFAENMKACVATGVELIEQPLAAGSDGLLAAAERPIPICADESIHVAADLDGVADRYDAINIKLDKSGGLTEALALREAAKARGLRIMVGSMVGTSLGMAPALLLAQGAEFVDLDGPLLLSRDRTPGLRYDGSRIDPAPPELWG
jgi:L-alanine-DL-glutamate epimerase-like enolase superfamily enzyme